MKMSLYVVIPNWNGTDFIAECLASLEQQSIKAKVIVVDNGSVDDSVNIIESQFPEVAIIKLPYNTGFAGGVNTGISYAVEHEADLIALFNNDAVADKNWLKNLVAVAEANHKAGIITGKLMRSDKTHIDSTGELYSIWAMPFPRGRNQIDQGQFEKLEPVFGATGGASLYRVEMLKKIGLFDENFFAYLEDVDVSFRARLAGWEVYYEPTAVAYHRVGATSSKHGSLARYHFVKNFHLLYLKDMPGVLFWKYLPLIIIQSARLMIGSLVKGQIATFFKAYFKAVSLIPATLKSRVQIQKSRQVSTSSIDKLLYKQRPPKIPTL